MGYGSLRAMFRSGSRPAGLAKLGELALAACSSDRVGGSDHGSAGTTTGGASLGGASQTTGGTSIQVGGGGGAGSPGGNPSCTAKATKARLPAVDVFVALDA